MKDPRLKKYWASWRKHCKARHLGKDIMVGFPNIVGGDVTEYAKLMAEAREQALSRLTTRAEALGADAVAGLRFTTSMIAQGSQRYSLLAQL